MPIKPPKCRTCGREEWAHTCLGPKPQKPRARKAYNREYWRKTRGPALKGVRKGKPKDDPQDVVEHDKGGATDS